MKPQLRFQPTLRDFLWLILVAAILVQWWIDHRLLSRKDDIETKATKPPSASVPYSFYPAGPGSRIELGKRAKPFGGGFEKKAASPDDGAAESIDSDRINEEDAE